MDLARSLSEDWEEEGPGAEGGAWQILPVASSTPDTHFQSLFLHLNGIL